MPDAPPINVYGADWCEDTQATRQQLDALGVPYRYINVDLDKAAETFIQSKNNGKRQTPTVEIHGQFLIEPDENELKTALKRD
jgi:glutaredoxin